MSSPSSLDPNNPTDVDAAIREYFASTTTTPPSFEAVWSKAQLQTTHPMPSGRRRWLPLAAAAAAFMTLTTVYLSVTDQTSPSQQVVEPEVQEALFHELVTSTRWQAPSDVLIGNSLDLQVWGLPTLDLQQNLFDEELL